MFATVGRAALLGSFCFFATPAGAQNTHPECMKMRDKLGCTCALNNGGGISPDGKRWFSVRGKSPNRGALTNQAFTNCIIRAGRS